MAPVTVTRGLFGRLPSNGAEVEKFQLKSESVTVDIISLGCTITALQVHDRKGETADVVLGFDSLEGYLNEHPYFGAVVGRVANRIAKGKFSLEGKEYQLAINNGPNSIHGGINGFDKLGLDGTVPILCLKALLEKQTFEKLWTPEVLPNGVRFSLVSEDGEEGYPGELKVWVTYTLDRDELTVNYKAQTNKTTPINLTNHSYFNLAGHGAGSVYDHEVSIAAEAFLPVDDTMIPTGEVASVQGTCFDLKKPVVLGEQLEKFHIHGFDHNFCLTLQKEQRYCARISHPPSGRALEVGTTLPGIQFYTANFLDGSLKGKEGAVYPKHSAFCLETQNWPDAVNKPNFPDVLLRPREEYNHTTWFKFSAA